MSNSHLKEEVLDRTKWKARFGRGFGPVVNECLIARKLSRIYCAQCAVALLFVKNGPYSFLHM